MRRLTAPAGRVRSVSGLIGLGESGLAPEWTGPDK